MGGLCESVNKGRAQIRCRGGIGNTVLLLWRGKGLPPSSHQAGDGKMKSLEEKKSSKSVETNYAP